MTPMFQTKRRIILASGSPRRRDFLESLGLCFEVIPALAPEPVCGPAEHPSAFTVRSAAMKAREVFGRFEDSLAGPSVIIGADTVVALHDEVMGKPENETDALAMLRDLAGQVNTVYTGCCCLFYEPGQPGLAREVVFYGESRVWMHTFSDDVLAAYVRTGEPMDKAGAYAIQAKGAFLIQQVQGSWTNIVGLPLDELVQVLLENGAIAPGRGPYEGP